MNLAQRSFTAAIWEFGSVISQAILQLTVVAILARLVPPEGFGLIAIANLAVGMVAMFSEIGVGPTVVQKKEIDDQFISSAFTLSIVLGLLGALATWIAAPFVAVFFKEPSVTALIRATCINLIVSGYITVASALLERELLFRKLTIINVTSYAIGFGVIGCSLAFTGAGVWAIVGASISQIFIRALLLITTTKKIPRKMFSREDIKHLLRFGTGISITQVFSYIANQLDNAIVGRLLGSAALGLYQMSFQIMDLPRRFLTSVIDRVTFATLTRVQDDLVRLKRGYLQSLELANLVLTPISVLLIIAAPEVVRVFLGDRWDGAILPLQILLTQIPLRASVRLADSTGTSVGKVYQIAQLKILYTVLIGIAAVVGARWGLVGVAVIVTIATLLNFFNMVWFTLHIIKLSLREYLRTWIPGVYIGTAAAITTLTCVNILRLNVDSEFLRLGALVSVLSVVISALAYTFPHLLGNSAIRLILELGRRTSIFPRLFLSFEKRAMVRKGI